MTDYELTFFPYTFFNPDVLTTRRPDVLSQLTFPPFSATLPLHIRARFYRVQPKKGKQHGHAATVTGEAN
jgi:hypothetical protein